MKKLLLVSLCFLMLCTTQVFAQSRTVLGTVTGKDDGLPIPGASVKIQGATGGTQTNTAGRFTLSVPAGAKNLVISFIGYETLTTPIPASGAITAVLSVSSRQLGEVVVTGALGIKRQAKEQGYAATNITAATLTETHPTNFTNGLTAKAPGLVINTIDNGLNPDTRFTLRGNRHIVGNNFALVVLNGVPISPSEVNSINPDDIESVNILNGAGAAALYGSEASNGALVITTKRGTATGAPAVTYSNTYQQEAISYFPKLQTEFGSYGGEGPPIYQNPVTGFIDHYVPFENQSYGPAYNGQLSKLGIPLEDGTYQYAPYSTPSTDPRRAFFQKGHSEQNSFSYAAGDALNSINVTANRLDKTDIVPGDSYNRTQFRISGARTAGIFRVEATAAFSQDNTDEYNNNPNDLLSTLLNTPSWVPLQRYKDQTQPFSDPSTYFNSYGVNPYWIIQNQRTTSRSDVFSGNFTGILTPTKWFDATYRLADNSGTYQEQQRRSEIDYSAYALTDPTIVYGSHGGTEASEYGTSVNPGTVSNITLFGDGSNPGSLNGFAGPQGYSRIQQDIFLNFHRTFFSDLKTNLLLGNTVWQEYANYVANGSNNLLVKNFYNVNYILGVPNVSQGDYKIRQIAYFADLSLGYKEYLFLDATLRNDHDSRLSAANRSFYYPSVKGSFLFSQAIDALKNNQFLSYGKLRASYSQVGDVNLNPYSLINTFSSTSGFPFGNTGALSLNTTLNNAGLKPELSNEVEFGTDLGLFNGRINLSATYYDTHTKDQTLPITTSPATGYNATILNIGETQNTGFETKLDVQVLNKSQNGVGLNLGGNFAIQNSKVLSLFGQTTQLPIGGYTTAATEAVVGKPYSALYVTDVLRDPAGQVIVDPTTGYPSINPNLVYAGQLTPKYVLGLTQTVTYKFITLSLTEEYRSGYVVYNGGLSSATAAGVSANTVAADRQRFIYPNSVINTGTAANPVYTPNTSISVQDGNLYFWDSNAYYQAQSTYVTSGAFWKLREADLTFDLTRFIKKYKFIKRASFALNGRNLLMYRPKTNSWSDPEFANSTLNGDLGVSSTAQLPPTRIYGGNLTVTF